MTRETTATRIGHIAHGLRRAVSTWRSRRELTQLDDRMLKDMGLSRAQALFEAERAPWSLTAIDRR